MSVNTPNGGGHALASHPGPPLQLIGINATSRFVCPRPLCFLAAAVSARVLLPLHPFSASAPATYPPSIPRQPSRLCPPPPLVLVNRFPLRLTRQMLFTLETAGKAAGLSAPLRPGVAESRAVSRVSYAAKGRNRQQTGGRGLEVGVGRKQIRPPRFLRLVQKLTRQTGKKNPCATKVPARMHNSCGRNVDDLISFVEIYYFDTAAPAVIC